MNIAIYFDIVFIGLAFGIIYFGTYVERNKKLRNSIYRFFSETHS